MATVRDVSELLVLHTLRLAGVAEIDVLRSRLSVDTANLREQLDAFRAESLVTHHGGTLPGWALTVAGRGRGEALLAAELDERGARSSIEDGYARFVELNGSVLEVCADWQIVAGTDPMALNDHGDPGYDRHVLDRLGTLHFRAIGVLAAMSRSLDRFGGYESRLGNALASARDGGVDWVTKPVIDSYHSVWFELHEDLLATLGRHRGDERSGERTEQGERR